MMYVLLQKLSGQARMKVIRTRLTQPQRKALEARIVELKAGTRPVASDDLAIADDGSSSSGDVSNEPDQESIDQPIAPRLEESFSEDEVDGRLFLCDGEASVQPDLLDAEIPLAGDIAAFDSELDTSDCELHSDDAAHGGCRTARCKARPSQEPATQEPTARRKGNGTAVGIQSFNDRRCNRCWYRAGVSIRTLLLTSRYSADLSVAVDNLAILTAIKAHILASDESMDFQSRIRHSVPSVLDDQGVRMEDLRRP
jgi:hypothetical protein